jgi:esterase/lipase
MHKLKNMDKNTTISLTVGVLYLAGVAGGFLAYDAIQEVKQIKEDLNPRMNVVEHRIEKSESKTKELQEEFKEKIKEKNETETKIMQSLYELVRNHDSDIKIIAAKVSENKEDIQVLTEEVKYSVKQISDDVKKLLLTSTQSIEKVNFIEKQLNGKK